MKRYRCEVVATSWKQKGVSMRRKNKEWLDKEVPVSKKSKVKSTVVIRNNSLFDIGKKMDLLTGNEMSFYIDQKGPRIGRLSTEIDLEYEASLEEQAHAEREIEKKLDLEMEFINENNDEVVPQQHTPRCKKKLTYYSKTNL